MTDNSDNVADPGFPFPDTLDAAAAARAAEQVARNKATLLNALALAGVTHIVVSFDGYGDSGQIEHIEARNGDDPVPMPGAMIELLETVSAQPETQPSTVSIEVAAESLAWDVLEGTHSGWENDQGAYGEIVFDVAANSITLDYNQRYEASDNFTHSF